MTDLLRNRILSYNGMSLFFILHFKPETISILSLNNLSNKSCKTYRLSANIFPNIFIHWGIISTPIEAIVCTVRTFFGPLWFKVKYFLYFCDVNDISYG